MTGTPDPQTFVVIATMITDKTPVDYRDWVTFARDIAAFIATEVFVGTTTFSQPDNPHPAVVVTGHGYPNRLFTMEAGLDELQRHHETVNSEIRVIIVDDYKTI